MTLALLRTAPSALEMKSTVAAVEVWKALGVPDVAIKPTSTKFKLDATVVIDWTTPTLQ